MHLPDDCLINGRFEVATTTPSPGWGIAIMLWQTKPLH